MFGGNDLFWCFMNETIADSVKIAQFRYYEHVLRREEDTMNVARYIFNNPVRKELVDDFRKYKSLGSFEFDLFTL